MRSPRVSAPARVGASSTSRSGCSSSTRTSLAALRRLERVEPVAAQQPALERAAQRGVGHHLGLAELAHVGEQQPAAGGARHEAGGVGPGDHEREPGRRGEQRGDLRHRLGAVVLALARGLAPQAGRRRRGRRARRARAGTPRAGRRPWRRGRPSGVVPSPSISRSAPERRSGAAWPKHAEHVGGRDALAGEQVADEPRAREPARDVVVQVGEQAPVARVQLGRGAEAEDRGVERVEAEARAPRRRAARRRRWPRGRRPATAPGRRRCRGRGAGRRGSGRRPRRARPPCGRARRGRRSRPRRVLQPRSSPAVWSAASSSGSPGFETTSGPLIGAPSCWSACATSWAISSRPAAVCGWYSPGAKKMSRPVANARAETARVSDAAVLVGVHAHVGDRAAERRAELLRERRVERAPAAADRGDRGLHDRVRDAARQDALAVVHARDDLAEAAVADARRQLQRGGCSAATTPGARSATASSSAWKSASRVLTLRASIGGVRRALQVTGGHVAR